MKIIENNYKKEKAVSEKHTCRWCKSKFEYDKSEVSKGDLVLSQHEEYTNIDGLICPACNRFDNLNNGYR